MAEFAFGGIESLPSWSRFVAVSVRMVPDADTQDQGLFNYKANWSIIFLFSFFLYISDQVWQLHQLLNKDI